MFMYNPPNQFCLKDKSAFDLATTGLFNVEAIVMSSFRTALSKIIIPVPPKQKAGQHAYPKRIQMIKDLLEDKGEDKDGDAGGDTDGGRFLPLVMTSVMQLLEMQRDVSRLSGRHVHVDAVLASSAHGSLRQSLIKALSDMVVKALAFVCRYTSNDT